MKGVIRDGINLGSSKQFIIVDLYYEINRQDKSALLKANKICDF